MNENSYDPAAFVELFRTVLSPEFPQTALILENLGKCLHPVAFCKCGCGQPYFIDPKSPQWQFMMNITAYSGSTLVILDIMKDWSIGSIELLPDISSGFKTMKIIEVD